MNPLAFSVQVNAVKYAVPAAVVEAAPAHDVTGDVNDIAWRSMLVNASIPDGDAAEVGCCVRWGSGCYRSGEQPHRKRTACND